MTYATPELHADNPLLGPHSRAEFIMQNLGLVHAAAIRLQSQIRAAGYEMDDAISEGTIGLIRSYDAYSDASVSFSTFAWRYIDGYIRNMYRSRAGSVRLSRRVFATMTAILRDGLDSLPAAEIAAVLEVPLMVAHEALLALNYRNITPLGVAFDGGEEDGRKAVEPGRADDTSNVIVDEYLSSLSEQQRHIVSLLMDGYSRSDIARIIGTTRQNVHNILARMQAQILKQNGGLIV